MSKPQYKLTYFNLRARAEIIRLVFAAAGVPYEDVRVTESQWPALKPKTPFGQLPTLEFEGHVVCQSNTIARYLANKHGLAGETDYDKLLADMIVDCLEDLDKPISVIFGEKDAAKKAALIQQLGVERLPEYLTKLEKLLVANKGGDGFFVGDSLTWADLSFISACSLMEVLGLADQLTKFPKLNALKTRVEKQPKIAQWIVKRPPTDF